MAYADTDTGVPLALDTFSHTEFSVLADYVATICTDRSIDEVVLGLPLLPSGEEGSQCSVVRNFSDLLREKSLPFSFVDERYSTPRNSEVDGDAAAAVEILYTKLGTF